MTNLTVKEEGLVEVIEPNARHGYGYDANGLLYSYGVVTVPFKIEEAA